MLGRLNSLQNQKGQITVFLALLFFLMIGIGFLVFGGMREYMKSSLVEESFDLAGEDVLANYDRPLFDRYHVFLMDPREESHISEDGKSSVDASMSESGFFQGVSSKISVTSSEKVLDKDGKALLTQIKEWETCQGIKKIPEILNQLLDSTQKKETISAALSECDEKEDTSSSEQGENGDEKGDSENNNGGTENQNDTKTLTETANERKVKKTWKEWKNLLSSILDSGILLYAVDDQSKISSLQLSSVSSLPSDSSWKNRLSFSLDHISLTGLSQLKKLCSEGVNFDKDSALLTSDAYLIPYIFECYMHYGDKDSKEVHRLKYEVEYLIGGKTKDKANLKYVADQMFLLRFMTNYAYAATNGKIKMEAETMALALTGSVGFPEGAEAVAMLLIASLCYGESLMEVRALFEGEKVALVKTQQNWNLTFSNAFSKVKNRSEIVKVSNGVTYEQYLAGLLVIQSGSRRLLYRMMDIMQSNVTLEEPDFLMKDCITSFRWTGTFSWNPFYKRLIAFGLSQNSTYSMNIDRTVLYK